MARAGEILWVMLSDWQVLLGKPGKTVMTANWGTAVSKNPYMSFTFSGGKKGDTLKVNWLDNKGATASLEETIK